MEILLQVAAGIVLGGIALIWVIANFETVWPFVKGVFMFTVIAFAFLIILVINFA